MPTTSMPTTSIPTTSIPTTSMPTTLIPTTSMPTTLIPTTSMPTTLIPTTTDPTTDIPTTNPTNHGQAMESTSIEFTRNPIKSDDGFFFLFIDGIYIDCNYCHFMYSCYYLWYHSWLSKKTIS
eukprot:544408_1